MKNLKYPEKCFNKRLDDLLPFISKDYHLQRNNNKYKVIINFLYLFNFRPCIEMTDILEKESCSECNISLLSLTQKIIETFANICLNNYSKNAMTKCNKKNKNKKLRN